MLLLRAARQKQPVLSLAYFRKTRGVRQKGKRKRNIKTRILVIGWIFAAFALAIFAKVGYLQIYTGGRLQGLADKQHNEVVEIQGARGNIYDCRGRDLAISITVPSVYAQTKQVKDKEDAADKLAIILKKPAAQILEKLKSGKGFVWIERKADASAGERVRALKIAGIGTVKESKRIYPRGKLSSHVIGVVNTDNKGIDGAELYFDKYLYGENLSLIHI